jgi:hypothetical protein
MRKKMAKIAEKSVLIFLLAFWELYLLISAKKRSKGGENHF